MARPTEDEIRAAFQTIVDNQHEPSLNWCVEYAKAGLMMTGKALDYQVSYVLGNMTRWRGEIAKAVRATLKSAKLQSL